MLPKVVREVSRQFSIERAWIRIEPSRRSIGCLSPTWTLLWKRGDSSVLHQHDQSASMAANPIPQIDAFAKLGEFVREDLLGRAKERPAPERLKIILKGICDFPAGLDTRITTR